MSTMPCARRRSLVREAPSAPARPESIDRWLDTIHGLARARLSERTALAPIGRELRARLAARSR